MGAGVVITGIGAWTAFGAGWMRTWNALCDGASAIAAAGHELPPAETMPVAMIRDLNPFRDVFPALKPPLPLKESRLLMVAVHEALADAALRVDERRGDDVGVMLDCGWDADTATMRFFARMLEGGVKATSPLLFSQGVANAPLGALAQHLGLRGPHLLTVGGGAFCLAVSALRSGEAQAIVSGGFDVLEGNRVAALHRRGLLGALGEGAVALVLEREEAARLRGARCYARVRACSCQLDAAAEPSPEGVELLVGNRSAEVIELFHQG